MAAFMLDIGKLTKNYSVLFHVINTTFTGVLINGVLQFSLLLAMTL